MQKWKIGDVTVTKVVEMETVGGTLVMVMVKSLLMVWPLEVATILTVQEGAAVGVPVRTPVVACTDRAGDQPPTVSQVIFEASRL